MKRARSPEAWYRDPSGEGLERWWDGRRWTASTRPVGATDYLWGSAAPVLSEAAPRRRIRGVALLFLSLFVIAGGTGLLVATAGAARSTDERALPSSAPQTVPSGASAAARASPSPLRTAPSAPAGSALAVLASLQVKGPAPLTGYSRNGAFGPAWLDVDRNGCDTRDDILRRDLTDLVASACRVRAGTLSDPYTGRTIAFSRGNATSTAVQIDHVVALANAWRTGAQQLSREQRIALANDRVNLFAVDGPTNQQKGAGDAATWLPPNRAFRCAYVAHQIAVKRAYGLWVVPAERDAMTRVLARCPATPVPDDLDATATADPDTGSTPSAATRTPDETGTARESRAATTEASSDPRYRTCADAERSGANTPYRRGTDVEYDWYQDRDGDGLVCE